MIKCIQRQFSIFININIIKNNNWRLYWMRQHVNGSHILWVVHVASLVSQAPVFMAALGKCLASPSYMNGVYGERTAGLTLTIFSYFFFSLSFLILVPKHLIFLTNLSILFLFGFDLYSFDYYLFYLK
jgi:hypothetical protein